MHYSILSFLFSWIFPTKTDRNKFRKFCEDIDYQPIKKQVKKNYEILLNNIKSHHSENRKYKVLFLANELSKWKAQSLYDLLDTSDKFEPVVAVTLGDYQWNLKKEMQHKILNDTFSYFRNNGVNCVLAYDLKHNKPIPLKEYSPDFVFYQQPWRIAKNQDIPAVSKFALTFYIPYYVPNYLSPETDYYKQLHQSIFKFYVLNSEWADLHKEFQTNRIGEICPVGHTMFDEFYLKKDKLNDEINENYVIYAPHHSINNFENFATFLWNGLEILEYAKKHPEINWVFKPHPTLKYALIKNKVMTEEQVSEYYAEWEKIGIACYTSDYIDLFFKSKALITDCASFLIEYFCTGKPIIHLISDKATVKVPKTTQEIFDTFYPVRNIEQLYKALDEVIIKGIDKNKQERVNMLQKKELLNNYAAKNIYNDLIKITGDCND